jgi:hypothetical protein
MGGNASDLLPRFPSQNQTAESAEILYNTLSLGFRLQAVQIKLQRRTSSVNTDSGW